MPKIFSAAKKQMLYKMLKQNCIILMKENGYKGLNIRDLTRLSGISPGTFYNFYQSKEDLILDIADDCQNKLCEQFMELYKSKGNINRDEFIDLYYTFFVADKDNILKYLSRDDLTALILRSKSKVSFDTVKNIIINNIKFLSSPKEDININAIINFIQLVNLCIENKDLLVEEELTNTIKKLLNNIADEIFKEE